MLSNNKKINRLRSGIMRKLTSFIGSSASAPVAPPTKEIRNILICRPNHRLGNLLLMTPLIDEIARTLPNAKVDLFTKGNLSAQVFKNHHNIGKLIELPKKPFSAFGTYLSSWFKLREHHYEVVINMVGGSSSGRIAANFAHADYRFYGDAETSFIAPDARHMAKYPVYSFRKYLRDLALTPSQAPILSLSIRLSEKEIAEGNRILHEVTGNEKPVICLFTNATGDKIYTEEWWTKLYEMLQKRFPQYEIIEILPVENTSQLGFKTKTYKHKDIRVVGSVIAGAAVFIGADSGMMHLASAVATPVVGLFKVTEVDTYEPYNAGSVGVDTKVQDHDHILAVVANILG